MAVLNVTKGIENVRPCQPHLIICEGIDDQLFLIRLLEVWAKDRPTIWNKYQVIRTEGNKSLQSKLEAISDQEGFADDTNTVESITVIFDADKDPIAASKYVCKTLKDAGFAYPSSPAKKFTDKQALFPDVATGFILFPRLDDCPAPGSLESLCLDIMTIDSASCIRCCVEEAIESLGCSFIWPNKNRLNAMLSFTNRYVGMKIGEAAKAGAFDFSSDRFTALRNFLLEMAGE